jgi:hypothetical protein
VTLDDLGQQAQQEIHQLLLVTLTSHGFTLSPAINKAIICGDPQAFLDSGFGSSNDLVFQPGTALGKLYSEAVKARRACQIYIIGRDEGLEQAMLWKLAND